MSTVQMERAVRWVEFLFLLLFYPTVDGEN